MQYLLDKLPSRVNAFGPGGILYSEPYRFRTDEINHACGLVSRVLTSSSPKGVCSPTTRLCTFAEWRDFKPEIPHAYGTRNFGTHTHTHTEHSL